VGLYLRQRAHGVPFRVCNWTFKVGVAKVPKKGAQARGAAAATSASADSDSESAESAGIRVMMVGSESGALALAVASEFELGTPARARRGCP
jgi:hypothetical protein